MNKKTSEQEIVINRESLNNIYEELPPTQKKVLNYYLEGYSDDEILKILGGGDRTLVTQHLRQISSRFGYKSSRENPIDYRRKLVELFSKYKPELVDFTRVGKLEDIPPLPPYPGSPLAADDHFYIKHSIIESKCLSIINQPGSLLRISSPQKMGKTSLIKQIIQKAQKKNYKIVSLEMGMIEAEKSASLEKYLESFYQYILRNLKNYGSFTLEDNDQESDTTMLYYTNKFENLLVNIDGNLLLIIDEVDKLFDYPHIYKEFFTMLRYWATSSSEFEIWKKLRLVITYSTEDYGRLDLHQSPFNLGECVKLEEFDLEQVKTLAYRYSLAQDDTISSLMALVGGHPYLLQLAFYYLKTDQSLSLSQLLNQATLDQGIYATHLRGLLNNLNLGNQFELRTQFQQILKQEALYFSVPAHIRYQLHRIGLIKYEDNKIKVRCQLYQKYFNDNLT